MHPARDVSGLDPRHVFHDGTDVIRRYGWGKTRGIRTSRTARWCRRRS